MERLMVLQLIGRGCTAQAWFNGMAVASIDPKRPRAVVPVHEYTVAGDNHLELLIGPRPPAPPAAPGEPPPPPEPRVAGAMTGAVVRILLPRIGTAIDEGSARVLAEQAWAPEEGSSYEVPLRLALDVPLPVSFPRWRWLDAPLCEPTPALRQQTLAFVQRLAQELAHGVTDGFIAATRLRTEELALAYQRRPDEELARLRGTLTDLYAGKRLAWEPLTPESFLLRSVAGGRLLECVEPSGEPALRTAADAEGRSLMFPLRVAVVEGKLYVLR